MPGGRPTKYDPKYCKALLDFFNVKPYETKRITKKVKRGKKSVTIWRETKVVNDLPMFSAFARRIGVSRDTLDEWCKVYPEFSDAYKAAKLRQEEILVANGLQGNYEQTFTIFTMKNVCGWRDKHDVEHTGAGGTDLFKNLSQVSDDELERRIAEVTARISKS